MTFLIPSFDDPAEESIPHDVLVKGLEAFRQKMAAHGFLGGPGHVITHRDCKDCSRLRRSQAMQNLPERTTNRATASSPLSSAISVSSVNDQMTSKAPASVEADLMDLTDTTCPRIAVNRRRERLKRAIRAAVLPANLRVCSPAPGDNPIDIPVIKTRRFERSNVVDNTVIGDPVVPLTNHNLQVLTEIFDKPNGPLVPLDLPPKPHESIEALRSPKEMTAKQKPPLGQRHSNTAPQRKLSVANAEFAALLAKSTPGIFAPLGHAPSPQQVEEAMKQRENMIKVKTKPIKQNEAAKIQPHQEVIQTSTPTPGKQNARGQPFGWKPGMKYKDLRKSGTPVSGSESANLSPINPVVVIDLTGGMESAATDSMALEKSAAVALVDPEKSDTMNQIVTKKFDAPSQASVEMDLDIPRFPETRYFFDPLNVSLGLPETSQQTRATGSLKIVETIKANTERWREHYQDERKRISERRAQEREALKKRSEKNGKALATNLEINNEKNQNISTEPTEVNTSPPTKRLKVTTSLNP